MPLILGIESTCDETAAAIVAEGRDVLAETVASQVDLHSIYGGVVPEIASRAHIEQILPVLSRTLSEAKLKPGDVDAIAVAHRPGLIGSLLIGVTAAKTLAWAWNKPLIGVDHVRAHLYSVMLDRQPADPEPPLPAVGLVVSGGHTALYAVNDWMDVQPLGHTIDDAVGEAYDKVAAVLNLPYPGGPIIDKLAQEGDPKAVNFPRSLLGRDSLDFSFSGIKTSVLYHVRGQGGREREASELSEQELRDVCASFQAACVETLVKKIDRAADRINAKSVIVGGGVSANRSLRTALASYRLPTFTPSPKYCTDNAAMISGLGNVLFRAGRLAKLDLDAVTQTSA